MRKIILGLSFILCLIADNYCLAWSAHQHEAIAKLAELNVKPATLAKIRDILKGETMVSVATWADGEIRQTMSETDHWHSVGIPVDSDVTRENITTFYPESNDNVIYQLKRLIAELKDPKTPAEVKYTDLKFLIHFTADLHMPMHCAKGRSRYILDTDANKAKEKAKEKPESLHTVWDGMIKIKNAEEFAVKMNKSITKTQKKKWAVNDPDLWVFESFKISKEIIFTDFPGTEKYITIPDGYRKKMEPVAQERIKQAGIRLAMLLDYVFAK
jgi:S1/P1 Nuclease